MAKYKIQSIICAVYGKPSSHATTSRAIDLALEHKAKLTFVHAIDAEFLKSSTPSMIALKTVYKQLHDLGIFAMQTLTDQAAQRGVAEVSYLVREGNVQEQLRQTILDLRPDMLVIGKPTTTLGSIVFKEKELDQFIAQLKQELALAVEIVESSDQNR